MTIGTLTPLQLIAGATLSNNTGVSIANTWTAADSAYTSTTLMTPFLAAAANSANALITANTMNYMFTFCASTVPALGDNVPSAYSSLGANTTAGFTGQINSQGQSDLGNGNVAVFAQIFPAANGYVSSTNEYINTAINSQTYLGSTFTTMNSLISGSITDVTLATATFGKDLAALGQLINLDNLGNFGSPAALLRQLGAVTNILPSVNSALIQAGLNDTSISQLTSSDATVSDDAQRRAYTAMTTITGTDLEQVLAVFGVTTPYIKTMADLLNPIKIFPNSYPSLTVRVYNQDTTSVLRSIYADNQGAVNSKLLLYLPEFILVQGSLTVIPYQRLSRIVPSDQALACKAIQVSLQQIKNVSTLSLSQLAAAFTNVETTRDLPSISALQQAVPTSVADFYLTQYATGTGPNGTLLLTNLLGAAVGIPYTSDLTNVTTTINTMTTAGYLNILIDTYVRMENTVNGQYRVGNRVIIPAGPGAGNYNNADSALTALIYSASIEVGNISNAYPAECSNLNINFNSMGLSLSTEVLNLSLASIDIPNLSPTGRGPIMSFVQTLPNYGLNTEKNGPSQFLETVADYNTQGGQAIIACLREGRNATILNSVNVGFDTVIPSIPATAPPQANLIPSTYSEAEAANLVVK